jgi:hypothetical protein
MNSAWRCKLESAGEFCEPGEGQVQWKQRISLKIWVTMKFKSTSLHHGVILCIANLPAFTIIYKHGLYQYTAFSNYWIYSNSDHAR